VYLRDEAEYLENGTRYVVDERTPRPEGDEWALLSEDISANSKSKTTGSSMVIQANKDHRLYSERGFFKLKDELAECVWFGVENLPEPEDKFVLPQRNLIQ
jgi:hypothetical protein